MSYSQEFMLGEISGKLDAILLRMDKTEKATEGLDGRLRKMEAWRWRITGGLTLLSVLVGILTRILIK